jgi:TolB-like protein
LESAAGHSNLEPKVMQLLQVLAANAGKALSRETLIDAVWGVEFGGDESLTRAVHLLRKALSSPHGLENAIRTIPRRGYVFDHEVVTRDADRKNMAEAVTPKSEPLIAVLPFDNLSSDPDVDFFSDGVSEDIIARLGRGKDLRVIGRTSSFQFRGDKKFEAASALGATHIVDGSVRRAGNRVRITAHLEQADTRETLWSDRYDRELKDIFQVQDAISAEIAAALGRKIEGLRQTVMAPEIYDLYLQGYAWTYSTERLLDAMTALEKVTEAAPDFAPAWGALARNRAMLRMYRPVQERHQRDIGVKHAIARALEIDPMNQDALNASYQRIDHFGPMLEHHDAINAMREMGGKSPTGLFLVSFHETCIGRMRIALETAIEAARLDPLNPMSASYPGITMDYIGRYEEARERLELSLARWPEDSGIRGTLMSVLAELGDTRRLAEISDPAILSRYPMSEFGNFVSVAGIRARKDPAEMRAFAERLADKLNGIGAADTNDLLLIGLLGGPDLLFDLLDEIRIGPTGTDTDSLSTIAYRSTLLFQHRNRTARQDRRFVKFCARLGLVKFWMDTGIRPDFADEVDYDFDTACRDHVDTPIDTYNPFPVEA